MINCIIIRGRDPVELLATCPRLIRIAAAVGAATFAVLTGSAAAVDMSGEGDRGEWRRIVSVGNR